MPDTPVDILQAEQTIDIQRGKTAALQRSQVTTGTLYPHDLRFFPRQRIPCLRFTGGVSTAIIGETKVGSQQVGSVYQQRNLIPRQLGCFLLIEAPALASVQYEHDSIHFCSPSYTDSVCDTAIRIEGNKIAITVLPAGQMGPPQRQFDLARTGVADIGYFLPGLTPGRFLMTDLFQLPFLFNRDGQLVAIQSGPLNCCP